MEFEDPHGPEFAVTISDQEVTFYRDNGYLKIERITTDEELEWLRDVYAKLLALPTTGHLDSVFDLARPYGTTGEPILGQLLMPEARVPSVHKTQFYRNARRISSRLLGIPENDVESWGHLIFKGQNSPAETPWHQDEAYWDVHKSYNALGTWLPLDDVDEKNGCMWFVPGSHKGEVLRHRHKDNDPNVHVLEFDEPVDTSKGVAVPLKAGGMTVHHARTHHYTGANSTDRIRRAWANEFQTQPEDRDQPADHPWWHAGKAAHKESFEKV